MNNDEHNQLKLITNLIILLLQIIIDNQFVSTIMDKTAQTNKWRNDNSSLTDPRNTSR